MPDENKEIPEKDREELRRLVWKNAHIEKCLNCDADVLVPLLGPFRCSNCNTQFRKCTAELIGHLDFHIDPEKQPEIILGAMHYILAKDDEQICFLCGATFPKQYGVCPEFVDFAMKYYCEPEDKRLPQTRDRIVAQLLIHEAVVKQILSTIHNEDFARWTTLNSSGLVDRLRMGWEK